METSTNLNTYTDEKAEIEPQQQNPTKLLKEPKRISNFNHNHKIQQKKNTGKTIVGQKSIEDIKDINAGEVKTEDLTNKFLQEYTKNDHVPVTVEEQTQEEVHFVGITPSVINHSINPEIQNKMQMSAEDMRKRNQEIFARRMQDQVNLVGQAFERNAFQKMQKTENLNRSNPYTMIALRAFNYVLPFGVAGLFGFVAYKLWGYFSTPKASTHLEDPTIEIDLSDPI